MGKNITCPPPARNKIYGKEKPDPLFFLLKRRKCLWTFSNDAETSCSVFATSSSLKMFNFKRIVGGKVGQISNEKVLIQFDQKKQTSILR